MSRRIDLTGKTFGQVKVIEYAGISNTHALWKCKCLKCNAFFTSVATNLRSGNTKGCNACRKKEIRDRKKLSAEQEKEIVYKHVKEGASMRDLAKEYSVTASAIFRAVHSQSGENNE